MARTPLRKRKREPRKPRNPKYRLVFRPVFARFTPEYHQMLMDIERVNPGATVAQILQIAVKALWNLYCREHEQHFDQLCLHRKDRSRPPSLVGHRAGSHWHIY